MVEAMQNDLMVSITYVYMYFLLYWFKSHLRYLSWMLKSYPWIRAEIRNYLNKVVHWIINPLVYSKGWGIVHVYVHTYVCLCWDYDKEGLQKFFWSAISLLDVVVNPLVPGTCERVKVVQAFSIYSPRSSAAQGSSAEGQSVLLLGQSLPSNLLDNQKT